MSNEKRRKSPLLSFSAFTVGSVLALAATTSINNHVRNVYFDYVVVTFKVEQRKGTSLGRDAARTASSLDLVGFDQVEDSGVEGGCHARGTSQVHGTLTHAIVYLVTFWLNNPVIPANVPKVNVIVFSATDFRVLIAVQAAFGDSVLRLPFRRLNHQEGLVGAAGRSHQSGHIWMAAMTLELQAEGFLLLLKDVLHCWHEGDSLPAATLAHQLLPPQRHSLMPSKEDLYGNILMGLEVQPQLGLKDMQVLAFGMGELEL